MYWVSCVTTGLCDVERDLVCRFWHADIIAISKANGIEAIRPRADTAKHLPWLHCFSCWGVRSKRVPKPWINASVTRIWVRDAKVVRKNLLIAFTKNKLQRNLLFKYLLSTVEVNKESMSKFLIGNQFHVKLRTFSPENCKQSLRVKSLKG